uniref:(northern house mosquito) hypothetical protein n=1 Tax=Culex pipiens TaxID=7175 RepID=A0A8D8D6V5_CULPI
MLLVRPDTVDLSCFCCSRMSAVVRSPGLTRFGVTLLSQGLELDFLVMVVAPRAAVMAATAATVEVVLQPHRRSDGLLQMLHWPSTSSLEEVVAFISISFMASARLPTVRAALGLLRREAAAEAEEVVEEDWGLRSGESS